MYIRSIAVAVSVVLYPFLSVSAAQAAGETFRHEATYNVLDAGNDSSGNIVSNTATTGLLGATNGAERHITVRERDGETTVVYIARGNVTTADRPGGVI
jgi:YD repeat-containing protein